MLDSGKGDSTFFARVALIASNIQYKEGYVLRHAESPEGRVFLQVMCWREDAVNPGVMGWGYGGKGYLSPHMTDQEIVQLAFGLFKGYEEHECREFFHYKGKRIYGPHISLEALLEIADRTTYRS